MFLLTNLEFNKNIKMGPCASAANHKQKSSLPLIFESQPSAHGAVKSA